MNKIILTQFETNNKVRINIDQISSYYADTRYRATIIYVHCVATVVNETPEEIDIEIAEAKMQHQNDKALDDALSAIRNRPE